MAAWLAYLKSCLLLPKDPEAGSEPRGSRAAPADAAAAARCDARGRRAAARARPDRARCVRARVLRKGLRLVRKSAWQVQSTFDLFAAYGAVRARAAPAMHVVHARSVMTLEEAIERVGRLIGMAIDWTELGASSLRPRTRYSGDPRSPRASSPRWSLPVVAASSPSRRSRSRRS